ncbi:MAG: TolB family protein [Planctomycetota bacterium]|jgi:Tol biopolymer transport system component
MRLALLALALTVVVWAQDTPRTGEWRLENIKQLTDGGENAEAYWSFDETKLIFQSTRPPYKADQIFTMNADGTQQTLVSTGKGRTTCAYYLPGDKKILYASTHAAGDAPPPPPDRSKGYVWPIYASYDIWVANEDGSDPKNLTNRPGYDAEATVSPKGDRIVFTSTRDGDIELYSMKLDGSDVKRLTNRAGYDGGAFFSWDGKKIVWRAPGKEGVQDDYHPLLKMGLVRPSKLEIWIMDADGSNKEQLTSNGKANFGPFWHPDGKRIVFSTNVFDEKGTNFELALVNVATKKVERVTWFARAGKNPHRSDDFDGFAMFTRDGKRVVWCSNRDNSKPYETNVFVADWKD